MAEENPIVEQIAANLKTAIDAITVTNGFQQDLKAVRPTRLGFADDEVPENGTVLITQDDPEPLDELSAPGNPALKAWRQPFVLIAFVIESDGATTPIETRINRVGADIQKKALEDPGRGNLAIDTHVQAPNIMNEGPRFTGIIVNVEVDYRTPEDDPYTKG